MKFNIKPTKAKETKTYKTIYLKDDLIRKIEELARENDTSFNNVVVSMIEACLADDEKE